MPGLWLPGGRGGVIRTHGCGSQSPVPYRLATSLYYGGPNHDFSLNSHPPAHTHDGRRVSTLEHPEGLEPPTR